MEVILGCGSQLRGEERLVDATEWLRFVTLGSRHTHNLNMLLLLKTLSLLSLLSDYKEVGVPCNTIILCVFIVLNKFPLNCHWSNLPVSHHRSNILIRRHSALLCSAQVLFEWLLLVFNGLKTRFRCCCNCLGCFSGSGGGNSLWSSDRAGMSSLGLNNITVWNIPSSKRNKLP